MGAMDDILSTLKRVYSGETVWLTKRCPHCGELYTREIEPEWAGVCARNGMCQACLAREEQANG